MAGKKYTQFSTFFLISRSLYDIILSLSLSLSYSQAFYYQKRPKWQHSFFKGLVCPNGNTDSHLLYSFLSIVFLYIGNFFSLHYRIGGTFHSVHTIDETIDIHTESLNSIITPGGMIHIVGHKIEGENPACGVWFVRQADGFRTKISENWGISRNNKLFGLIPQHKRGQGCRWIEKLIQ